jgi:hypothetical protein
MRAWPAGAVLILGGVLGATAGCATHRPRGASTGTERVDLRWLWKRTPDALHDESVAMASGARGTLWNGVCGGYAEAGLLGVAAPHGVPSNFEAVPHRADERWATLLLSECHGQARRGTGSVCKRVQRAPVKVCNHTVLMASVSIERLTELAGPALGAEVAIRGHLELVDGSFGSDGETAPAAVAGRISLLARDGDRGLSCLAVALAWPGEGAPREPSGSSWACRVDPTGASGATFCCDEDPQRPPVGAEVVVSGRLRRRLEHGDFGWHVAEIETRSVCVVPPAEGE